MNPDPALRPDLLSAGIPTAVVTAIPLATMLLWVAAHHLTARLLPAQAPRLTRLGAFAARTAAGTVAVWSVWQAVARFIALETNWPLWTSALVGALAIETVIALIQAEKSAVSRPVGRTLLALRLLAVACLLTILAEPSLSWIQERKIERRVVVLVDDSESMQLADAQATASEKLEIASLRGAALTTGRPDFESLATTHRAFREQLARELDGWPATAAANSTAAARRTETLEPVIESGLAISTQAAAVLAAATALASAMDDDGRRTLNEITSWLRDQLPAELSQARQQLAAQQNAPARQHLTRAAELARLAAEALPSLAAQASAAFVQKLDAAGQEALNETALIPRAQIAREVLTRPNPATGTSLLEQLQATYDVTVLRFGRDAIEWPNPAATQTTPDDPAFRTRTDLAAALTQTIDRVPAESLAGVLLLSDGRHNGPVPVDDPARSLGLTGAPLHAVAIGSTQGPKDAAILKIDAPESIYLGDRLKIRAEIKADGLKGTQLKIILRQGDRDIESQTLAVPEDSHRTTVNLSHTPAEKGIFAYSLHIEPVEGELFATNNHWPLETAVTDDRTTVLLVDSVPRWEFRYLRNLFYGRDKSVHLQYLLLNPDEIEGQAPVAPVFASASRKFGEAEANRLPDKFEEWMKFDVIILGDLPPAALPAQTWDTIEKAVAERGALLVVVAGPRAMPHAYQSEVVKRLLPLEFASGTTSLFDGPEESFAVRLTAEGKNSPILALGASQVETGQIWDRAPSFMWRHPVRAARPGAEVLAYAEPSGQRPLSAAATAEERLAAFARQRQLEAERALLTTSRHGLGRVALFTTDQTWRLRYGIGDTHHHKLWGNLLRWGTTENLRAGTETVRLGTDALTYETGQPVRLLARLTAEGYKPENDARVTATVFDPNGAQVATRQLAYREGTSGLYEASLEPLPATGRYRVELSGPDVKRLLQSGSGPGPKPEKIETHFTQQATLNPVELGDLAVDADLLRRATTLAGGRVTTPTGAATLASAFGTGTKLLQQRRETSLWDRWPLLTLLLAALTAEWLLRRKAGLA